MSERIQVGDVFEDLDPRMRRADSIGDVCRARRVKVVGIEDAPPWAASPTIMEPKVIVVDLDTGRHARIEEDRLLQGGARGYKKVEGVR
jgi:hypothetical protein